MAVSAPSDARPAGKPGLGKPGFGKPALGKPSPGKPSLARPARPGWMRAVDALSGVCGAVAATMILVAVLLTCQMIWVRTVNNASTVWQTETVIYLMIGATLLGLPYVQRWRGHVNVDLLPRLLPPAAARGLAVLTLGTAVAVMGVMLWYGFEMWHVAWERGWRSDTVWGPPLWIPYLAMPVGLALYLVQLVSDLVAVATGVDAPFAPAHAPGERADAALEQEGAAPMGHGGHGAHGVHDAPARVRS